MATPTVDTPTAAERALARFHPFCENILKGKGKRGREEYVESFATHFLEHIGAMAPPSSATEAEKKSRKAHRTRVRTMEKDVPDVFDMEVETVEGEERADFVELLMQLKTPNGRAALIAQT